LPDADLQSPEAQLPPSTPLDAPPVTADSSKPLNAPPVVASDDRVESEDPEKAALAFVEQNQKHAESQLKNLKNEEAKLRARLQKVQAGIRRWETLIGAFKQNQGSVVVVAPRAPTTRVEVGRDSEPHELEPVVPGPKSLGIPQSRVESPVQPTDDPPSAIPTPK